MGQWTPETPWFKSRKKTQAYWPPYVCKNPNCKNNGRSHPNCKCRPPSFAQQSRNLEYDAEGGEVGKHFCEEKSAHDPSCEHFADGGTILANQEIENNPSLALDHAIVSHGLLHALTKTGHSRSENLHKPTEDFLNHVSNGKKLLNSHAEHHFDFKHEHPEVKNEEVSALDGHLNQVLTHPAELLNTGSLPEMPAHSAALGAKAATVSDYFNSLKPKQALPGPLDPVMPVDKMADQSYRRQLAIAERPLSILTKAREGTVIPADLQTLAVLYPELAKVVQDRVFNSLVEAKTNGQKISYKHKMGLSFLLGQPLDATMTQSAMVAITRANAGAQVESQGMPKKHSSSGATEATQKTMAKTDDLYKTQLEKIQTEK